MPRDFLEFTEINEDDNKAHFSDLSEPERETKVIEFIHLTLRKDCVPGEYTKWLQDGKIIEEVMYKSCPTPLGSQNKKRSVVSQEEMSPKDRIERIINDLFEFGVSIDILFDVDDLLKAKNIPKVTTCLLEVKNMICTGQGRSRLKSVQDVVKAPFRCAVCKEKFSRSDQLKQHLCSVHPEKIGPAMKSLLERHRNQ